MARNPIKKSVRFEVFKRDFFACQYCGQKAPDVVLEIDHITPVAGGGDNDILNLVTACRGCNAGKSDRKLSESAVVDKRRSQLESLEERRQQLEMLYDWHRSLIDLNDQAVDLAESLWFESLGEVGSRLTDSGRDEIRKLIKRHSFDKVCEAIRRASEAALRSPYIDESRDAVTNEWFWKISRVLTVGKLEESQPGTSRLLYVRGILRNRVPYLNETTCIALLKNAHAHGVLVDWMETVAKQVTSWSQFRDLVDDAIDRASRYSQEGDDGPHP